MALNRRILRVLVENKAQYLGSIVLILFSTFMFTVTSHFAMNFERLANEFQEGYVQEDATFTTSQKIDDLAALEAQANALIEEGAALDYPLAEGQTLRIFRQNERVNLTGVVEGSGLSKSGEILISPTFATLNGYAIGDTLRVMDQSFTVTGLMALPNYIYVLQSDMDMMAPPGFGIAVVSKADFAALGSASSFYAVKFTDPAQNPRDQSIEFKALLKNHGIEVVQWTDIDDNRRVNIVTAEVEVLNLMSRAVPGAVLLLVIILISGLVRRMIQRESTIIGALYALGYTRAEIQRHYLLFPLIIALIGGSIGTLLGIFPVRSAVAFFTSYFNMPLTGIEISPLRILISLLLPLLFLAASAYVVTRKALGHSPVELMRGKEADSRVSGLERALKLERFNFATKFKIREQLRSLSRLAFLLFGVAAATLLLLWGFALKSGFDYMLTNGLTSVYNYVYEYNFDSLVREPLPAGGEPFSAALFLPETAPGAEDNRDFYVNGVLPDSRVVTLVDASGAALPTNQVIITRPLADQLQVQPGGTTNIVRKLDGRVFSLKIDRIAETYAGKFIFMPLADYNQQFEMPEGSYNGAFSSEPLALPESQPYRVVTMAEKVAGIREAIAPTESMISLLAVVAFIIGVIVIYLVTTMIVEENKQTISLMKIFGYRKKEINALILNSSTIVVVTGFLLGIPLTLSALGGIVQSMEASVGLAMPPGRIDPPYLLVSFIAVMLSYEVSKLLCRKKVNAIPMSEALKAGTE